MTASVIYILKPLIEIYGLFKYCSLLGVGIVVVEAVQRRLIIKF